jgi:SAM-dependent methyltransferase
MITLEAMISRIEDGLCRVGLVPTFTWARLLDLERRYLYAGDLRPDLPQYSQCVGLTPFRRSRRTIDHDVTTPMPIPADSIDRYQSEDVFEHIDYYLVPNVIEEIFRVLKPGALFRLSVPDYGFDIYRARSIKGDGDELIFDPVGGGSLQDGRVVGGGHLWFPTLESVRAAFAQTSFAASGDVRYLHGYEADGRPLTEKVDYSLGHVKRTPDHDPRGQNPYRPISIVVDAWKAKSGS